MSLTVVDVALFGQCKVLFLDPERALEYFVTNTWWTDNFNRSFKNLEDVAAFLSLEVGMPRFKWCDQKRNRKIVIEGVDPLYFDDGAWSCDQDSITTRMAGRIRIEVTEPVRTRIMSLSQSPGKSGALS